jgi:hypothetical protein
MLARMWRKKEPYTHCWWECKLVQPLWKSAWRFLKKLKLELPSDPAIPLLGISEECKSVYKYICQYTTEAPAHLHSRVDSSTIQNQPRCPSNDGWIKKMWWMYTYGVLLSHEEGCNYIICRKMDGTGNYQVKQNNPSLERQMSQNSLMWNLDLKYV